MLKEKIDLSASAMSSNQRKIASFVQANFQSAAFQTAAEICNIVGVSESSVVRFAKFLGYDSYASFRKASYHEFTKGLSTEERFNESNKNATNGIDYSAMFQRDIDAINSANENIPSQDIDGLAEAIVSAQCVYVAAARGSFVSAYHLVYHLSWLLPSIRLLPHDYPLEILSNANKTHKKSLLIGIDFPRYLNWTIDVMRHARKMGLPVAAITDSKNSPLAEGAEHVLAVPYRTISFVDSCASVVSTVNCIVLAVSRRRKVAPQLRKLEDLWRESNVYSSNDSSIWLKSLNEI